LLSSDSWQGAVAISVGIYFSAISSMFEAPTGPDGRAKKTVRLFMNGLIGLQDRSGRFATAVAFSLFESLLEVAQAYSKLLLASKTWTVGADSRGPPHRIATYQQSVRSPAP
jgi:hypothetical protein